MPKTYICFLVILIAFILNNMGSRGDVKSQETTIRPPRPQVEAIKPPKPINKLSIGI